MQRRPGCMVNRQVSDKSLLFEKALSSSVKATWLFPAAQCLPGQGW